MTDDGLFSAVSGLVRQSPSEKPTRPSVVAVDNQGWGPGPTVCNSTRADGDQCCRCRWLLVLLLAGTKRIFEFLPAAADNRGP